MTKPTTTDGGNFAGFSASMIDRRPLHEFLLGVLVAMAPGPALLCLYLPNWVVRSGEEFTVNPLPAVLLMVLLTGVPVLLFGRVFPRLFVFFAAVSLSLYGGMVVVSFFRPLLSRPEYLLGFLGVVAVWAVGMNRLSLRCVHSAYLAGRRFTRCSFRGASIERADLRGARFESCVLAGACFARSDLRGVQFIDCDLRDVSFDLAIIDSAADFAPR